MHMIKLVLRISFSPLCKVSGLYEMESLLKFIPMYNLHVHMFYPGQMMLRINSQEGSSKSYKLPKHSMDHPSSTLAFANTHYQFSRILMV